VRPIAVTSGIRPLLRSTRRLGAAPREHRVIADGPLLTIAGGKFTTFRRMARDVVRAAGRALGRGGMAIRDSDEPLPAPFEASGSHEDLAHFAIHHEFARTLADVIRRRTRLWLAPDRGRARARALADGMAEYLGWDVARKQAELDGFERGLAEEARWIDQAMEDG
jgi:glycerol-3-phosphate dehydrogenase